MRALRPALPWLLGALASLSLMAAACGQHSDPSSAPETPAPPAPSTPPPSIERSRPLMSTIFRIQVMNTPAEVAEPAIRDAFDEIARLETVLSEWLPESEISRINRDAGGAPIHVGEDTFAVIQAGLEVSRASEGAFDLSWAALRGLYSFHPGEQVVPSTAELRARLGLIDYRQIELDEDAHTVRLKRPGMTIGTGGIAKGYALDRAGAILRRAGVTSYMLFGGGQVQVHGLHGDRPWRVGIQHPRREGDYFAFLEVVDRSISTSGDYEHFFFDAEGTRWHHILDPRTGLPARRSISTTLVAPSGLYADALSTAAFVLGPERAARMLERLPFHAEAVMLDAHCRIVTVGDLDARLHLRPNVQQGVVQGCDGVP
ncbi:MAG: FAD:protein FMN transferase [Deltaproteobacteria bacterium]|nr:FAD:protein FMN transferase [Deltaproteobacteria bacterium]